MLETKYAGKFSQDFKVKILKSADNKIEPIYYEVKFKMTSEEVAQKEKAAIEPLIQ